MAVINKRAAWLIFISAGFASVFGWKLFFNNGWQGSKTVYIVSQTDEILNLLDFEPVRYSIQTSSGCMEQNIGAIKKIYSKQYNWIEVSRENAQTVIVIAATCERHQSFIYRDKLVNGSLFLGVCRKSKACIPVRFEVQDLNSVLEPALLYAARTHSTRKLPRQEFTLQ